MTLYHYCTRLTLDRIIADGVIRAQPQRLYRDAMARRLRCDTPPIVWLTENPLGEGTTLLKAMGDGYRGNGVGYMTRIVVGDSHAETLLDFTRRVDIPRAAWQWVIASAERINIDPDVWRVRASDIPAAEWRGVEVMTGIDDEGTTWAPLPE